MSEAQRDDLNALRTYPGRGPLLVAVGALAIACASAGSRFDPTKLSQLEPGQTTVSQAIAILGGPPYSLAQNPDGSRFLVWSYTVAYPWDVQTRAVEILFDAEGRMVRIEAGINVEVPDRIDLDSEVEEKAE